MYLWATDNNRSMTNQRETRRPPKKTPRKDTYRDQLKPKKNLFIVFVVDKVKKENKCKWMQLWRTYNNRSMTNRQEGHEKYEEKDSYRDQLKPKKRLIILVVVKKVKKKRKC